MNIQDLLKKKKDKPGWQKMCNIGTVHLPRFYCFSIKVRIYKLYSVIYHSCSPFILILPMLAHMTHAVEA